MDGSMYVKGSSRNHICQEPLSSLFYTIKNKECVSEMDSNASVKPCQIHPDHTELIKHQTMED